MVDLLRGNVAIWGNRRITGEVSLGFYYFFPSGASHDERI